MNESNGFVYKKNAEYHPIESVFTPELVFKTGVFTL